MKTEPVRLRAASKAFLLRQRDALELLHLCKQPACSKSEQRRGVTCIHGGAYGVVGVSGVKDARRESFLADASASAPFSAVFEEKGSQKIAEGLLLISSPIASGKHPVSKRTAP